MRTLALLFLVPSLLGAADALAQAEKAALLPREAWTTAFADQEVTLNFDLRAPADFKGRAIWSLAVRDRRLLGGEKEIQAGGRGPALKLTLRLPEVRPGVVLETELRVGVFPAGATAPLAETRRTIWIFSSDPLADRRKWAEDLKLKVYDPDSEGRTLKVLKQLKWPFEEIARPEGLLDVKDGVLLVGAGASFKEQPGLMTQILEVRRRGVGVVLLAPVDGSFPMLPEGLRSVRMSRSDRLRQLDPRLDRLAWGNQRRLVQHSLTPTPEDNRVLLEVTDSAEGWPLLEWEFAPGRMVVCCFSVVSLWDQSPTPRYLLWRLLEHVSEK